MVLATRDGSVGLEISAFTGIHDIANRAAVGCSYTVRAVPAADLRNVTVVFAGAPDRVRLHAYDLPLPADDHEAIQTLALARIGEFLDERRLPVPGEDLPSKIECNSVLLKAWRERNPADDDQIEQYIRSSLYWSWRFAQDQHVFSAPDALRLGVPIQQLQRVARLGEDVDWIVTGHNIEMLVLRPTQQLLRAEKDARASALKRAQAPPEKTHDSMSSLRLFISHSSKDAEYVGALIDLLRSGLNLAPDHIRCTSVDGYRLPAGADANETLRREIHASAAFIGVLSKHSLQSQYVMFELGARWGAGKHLIPVLAPGTTTHDLSDPLAGLNALEGYRAAPLHQLVRDLAEYLNVNPSTPAAYQRNLDAVLAITAATATPQVGAARV